MHLKVNILPSTCNEFLLKQKHGKLRVTKENMEEVMDANTKGTFGGDIDRWRRICH
jgi:hypothetical protein